MKLDFEHYLRKHFQLRTFRALGPGPDGSPETEQAAPPVRKGGNRIRKILPILKALPYLCAVGFITSFFLDFDQGDVLWIGSTPIRLEGLLRTLCIGGLIGYGTNWLAIKMLFRPLERRPVWGQGLIPAQRDRVINALARGIHNNILSEDLIKQRIDNSGIMERIDRTLLEGANGLLTDEDFVQELKEWINHYLQDYLGREEVKRELTGIIDQRLEKELDAGWQSLLFRGYRELRKEQYQVLLDKVVQRIPASAMDLVEALDSRREELVYWLEDQEGKIHELLTRIVTEILQRIDIHKLLVNQMEHLDESRLEQMIWGATNTQLLYIQYLGGLLGLLGGLLIWQPGPVGISFAVLFVIFYLADNLLYRKQQKKQTQDFAEHQTRLPD